MTVAYKYILQVADDFPLPRGSPPRCPDHCGRPTCTIGPWSDCPATCLRSPRKAQAALSGSGGVCFVGRMLSGGNPPSGGRGRVPGPPPSQFFVGARPGVDHCHRVSQRSVVPRGDSGQPPASSGAAIANGGPPAAPGPQLELLKKPPPAGWAVPAGSQAVWRAIGLGTPTIPAARVPAGLLPLGGRGRRTPLRHRFRARSSTREVAARKYDAPVCVCVQLFPK